MHVTPTTQAADLAAHFPETIRVFQRHGIDFCCGGKRSLESFCAEKEIDFAMLAEELEDALSGPGPDGLDWMEAPLPELVDHIVDFFHARLRRNLPPLVEMAKKAAARHGERVPGVYPPLAEELVGLAEELRSHMMKEEEILFPWILHFDAATGADGGRGLPPFGQIEGPMQVMELEHDAAGSALERMRRLTNDYAPPEDACNTVRGLFAGLAELEAELHQHIHLENNVLFPRIRERLAALEAAG